MDINLKAHPHVSGEGNPNADIMFVGEAPGEEEESSGRPFVGNAGQVFNELLAHCGLVREEVFITNVIKVRPPNNKVPRLKELGLSVDDFIDELYDEIQAVQPKIIVPMGNIALDALLNETSITKHRGSVFSRQLHKNRGKRLWVATPETNVEFVIPTLHPSYYFRVAKMKPIGKADFIRVREALAGRLDIIARKTIMKPSLIDVLNHIENIIECGASCLSFDVETWKGYITCLAIATKPDEAFCIPFWSARGQYWSPNSELQVWAALKRLFATPIPKIAHNAMFDCKAMAWHGVEVHNMLWDTMLMHHMCYGEMPHDLGFLTSLYTTQVFYKDDGKHWTPKDGDEQYWNYNGLDAMIPVEIHRKLFDELVEFGLDSYYFDEIPKLMQPLTTMSLTGFHIDKKKRDTLIEGFTAERERVETELSEKYNHGEPLNTSSTKQVPKFLYETLSLPPTGKISDKTGHISADAMALVQLATRYPDRAYAVAKLIMRARKMTRYNGFLKTKLDPLTERLICSYKIHGTRYARISSSKDILRECGTNLQNWPRGGSGVRACVTADDGYVFIHADLKGAEVRVVAHLSQDPRLLELFEQGGDVHKKAASWIFNLRLDQIDKKKRYLGKRTVHAGNYKMGWYLLTNLVAKDAIESGDLITMTAKEGKGCLANYHDVFQQIKPWHARVEAEVRATRCITDLFGRSYYFFDRMDDKLIRSAVSCNPQSTVANLLDRGLVRFFERFRNTAFLPRWPNKEKPALQLHGQIHDAILISCLDDSHVIELMKTELIKAMSIPLTTPQGVTFTIPIDITVGTTWEEVSE